MKDVILIAGSSSGFGLLAAKALAHAKMAVTSRTALPAGFALKCCEELARRIF